MNEIWTNVVSSVIVIALLGVVWKMLNDKIEDRAGRNKENIELKVDKSVCVTSHDSLSKNLVDLKADNKAIFTSLNEISTSIAYWKGQENGGKK